MTQPGPLVQLGATDETHLQLAAALQSHGAPESIELARVLRVDRGEADLVTRNGPMRATMTKAAKDCVAGDWVGVETDKQRVAVVLERTTAFVRRAARGAYAPQTLAANMDWVVICQGLVPGVNLRRLERELVIAFDSGATPLVVLTKSDLVSADEAAAAVDSVASVTDVDVMVVSNETGEGLDELSKRLAPGQTFALVGSSGVGKSSIINALGGEAIQAVGEVRSGDEKGKHTTTAAVLLVLEGGRLLLDTPGVRALALWKPHLGIDLAFPEFVALGDGCRFADCSHRKEPGCAVSAARADGEVDAARFENWQQMRDEITDLDRALEERDYR